MAKRRKFTIYRSYPKPGGFTMVPANLVGFLIFLLNLGVFCLGVVNVNGDFHFLSESQAIVLIVLSVGFFFWSLYFCTEYVGHDD